MSSADNASVDALDELRAEIERLRSLPVKERNAAMNTTQKALAELVARAVVSVRSVRSITSELDFFGAGVVANGVASVWEQLPDEVRRGIVNRIKHGNGERIVNEGVMLAAQLLRSEKTSEWATDVLVDLGMSDKAIPRLVTQLFGKDPAPLGAIRLPKDATSADSVLRLLLRASGQEKAHPGPKLRMLQLALNWLLEENRWEGARYRSLVPQVRELAASVDRVLPQPWQEIVTQHPEWIPLLDNPATALGGHSEQPSVSPGASIQDKTLPPPPTPPSVPSEPGDSRLEVPPRLPLEEAQRILQNLHDERVREAHAMGHVLGAIRAAEALKAQGEREAERLRAETWNLRAKCDDIESREASLREAVRAAEDVARAARVAVTDRDAECEGLRKAFGAAEDQKSSLEAALAQERVAWTEQRRTLETRIVENADARIRELQNRVADRARQLLADVSDAPATRFDGVGAVLHTRLNELLDALMSEGFPVRGVK